MDLKQLSASECFPCPDDGRLSFLVCLEQLNLELAHLVFSYLDRQFLDLSRLDLLLCQDLAILSIFESLFFLLLFFVFVFVFLFCVSV